LHAWSDAEPQAQGYLPFQDEEGNAIIQRFRPTGLDTPTRQILMHVDQPDVDRTAQKLGEIAQFASDYRGRCRVDRLGLGRTDGFATIIDQSGFDLVGDPAWRSYFFLLRQQGEHSPAVVSVSCE
jgi:hypothetical protein